MGEFREKQVLLKKKRKRNTQEINKINEKERKTIQEERVRKNKKEISERIRA